MDWQDDKAECADTAYASTFNAASTTATPTVESIRQAMREFQEKTKDLDLGPDVWVLTDDEYRQLELLCEKRNPDVTWNGIPADPWTIYGIRVEHLPTREQVRARVHELHEQGMEAGFLMNEDEQ